MTEVEGIGGAYDALSAVPPEHRLAAVDWLRERVTADLRAAADAAVEAQIKECLPGLGQPGMMASGLAAHLRLPAEAVSAALRRLEDAGVAERAGSWWRWAGSRPSDV